MTQSKSPFFPQSLHNRFRDDLQLAGKSARTQQAYLRAVRQLADYCRCSPEETSEDQLRRYFLYLKNDKQFAFGSLRVALSGIKFFYAHTVRRSRDTFSMLRLQSITTIPEVLTVGEVHRIIDAATQPRMMTYFWTVNSMGLRLNEGLNLQVPDLDSQRGWVHIHRGKGAKDRYIPLPTSTLRLLRNYWKTHQHCRLLFPADGRNHSLAKDGLSTAKGPMSETAVQGAMKKITGKLGFTKKASIHFATFLRHALARSRRVAEGHPEVLGPFLAGDHDGLPAHDRQRRREREEGDRENVPA